MGGKFNLDKKEILKACRQVEMLMANIYFALAKAHQADLELSKLWQKTAREEENHARQFDSALRLIEAVAEDVKVTRDQTEKALEQASSLLKQIQGESISPIASLGMAIDMERSFAEFHMHLAVTFQRESDKKMFMAMMSADNNHIQALSAALEKRTQA